MGIISNRPIKDGVQHRECAICHETFPEQKPYFSTNGLNARGEMCFKSNCADCQYKYQQQFKAKGSQALIPTETRAVPIVEGLDVQVGWHGDAKYWPVKPLAHLCKRGFTAWPKLYAALTSGDQWASTVTPVVMVGADGRHRSMACLPWERWAAFWLEFGGDNPQSQSVRTAAQQALAMAFGDTAESNRAAAVAIHQGYTPSTAITAPLVAIDPVEQIKNGVTALLGPLFEQLILSAVSNVLEQRFGAMPDQVAETHETLRGATVIEREVRTEVHSEWMTNGYCYLAIDTANNRLAIGETNKEPARRLEDSDYNGGKSGGAWQLAYSFATDDRKAAERDLIQIARSAGAVPVVGTRGTFVYERRIEQDFKQLPARMKYENLRRWVAQARLFEVPMFIYDQ